MLVDRHVPEMCDAAGLGSERPCLLKMFESGERVGRGGIIDGDIALGVIKLL